MHRPYAWHIKVIQESDKIQFFIIVGGLKLEKPCAASFDQYSELTQRSRLKCGHHILMWTLLAEEPHMNRSLSVAAYYQHFSLRGKPGVQTLLQPYQGLVLVSSWRTLEMDLMKESANLLLCDSPPTSMTNTDELKVWCQQRHRSEKERQEGRSSLCPCESPDNTNGTRLCQHLASFQINH